MTTFIRALFREALLVLVLFAPAAWGAANSDGMVYELRAGSTITDDCINCDRAPREVPLVGTFVLALLSIGDVTDAYSVKDVDFGCPFFVPGGEYGVRGQGTYLTRLFEPPEQEMTLEVAVNGVGGVKLASGPVTAAAPWPTIEVTVTEDGQRDPLHRYTLRIVAAPRAKSFVAYELVEGSFGEGGLKGSYFIDDCKICGRPTIPVMIGGTFELGLIESRPDGTNTYRVDSIDFLSLKQAPPYHIISYGTYREGGDLAVHQEMDLLGHVNDDCGVRMASGQVAVEARFPQIEIQLEHQNPTSQLHVYSLHLVAKPVGPNPPGFRRGDSNGDGGVDIADAVHILLWRFSGGKAPGCLDAADVNLDQRHDLSDAVSILQYLFQGGAPPPAPGPDVCGLPPEPVFGCESYTQCQ